MELIKQLRERTGAGIVDCKAALTEAGNDIEKAVDILRKKGIAKAAKRGDREATQGTVKVAVNSANTEGYIFEMNAETDFVVRNDQFKAMSEKIMALVIEKTPSSLEELNALEIDGSSVEEAMTHLSGVIGEKIAIGRYAKLSSQGTVAGYAHPQGNIGVLIALDKSGEQELAASVAMHVAAANPRYLKPEDVDAAELEREKEVYREQLAKEGKPAEMLEKILQGKVNKYYEEVSLLKQEYVKDDKKKVEEVLGGAQIEAFIRYSL